jgi:hypothetical protein
MLGAAMEKEKYQHLLNLVTSKAEAAREHVLSREVSRKRSEHVG